MTIRNRLSLFAARFVGVLAVAFSLAAVAAPTRLAVRLGERATPFATPSVTSFYVATDGNDANDGSAERPVLTLQRAVELTRTCQGDGERHIVFRDGYYSMTNRVNLGESDYNLTIRAENPGQATLSGGARLTSWYKHPDSYYSKIWVADVALPTNNIQFSLSLDSGKACTIAEYGPVAYKGNGNNTELIYIPTEDDKTWGSFDKIDTTSAWLSIQLAWSTPTPRIARNDLANNTFWLSSSVDKRSDTTWNHGFYLMNTIGGLSVPRSWMYTVAEQKVLFLPSTQETLKTFKATISTQRCLIYANKTPKLTIKGLVFESCARDYAFTGAYTMPHCAPISCYYTTDTVIDGVTVRNCAYDGIAATKPTRFTVKNSTIYNVGNGAINMYDGGNGGFFAYGNTIYKWGTVHGAANGIRAQTSNSEIVRNNISDGPGCAIVLWGERQLVASNVVKSVCKSTDDAGGLYGGYADSLICDNDFSSIASPSSGFYCDEGGFRNLFTRNKTSNIPIPIHMHQTQYNVVSNNTFNYTDTITVSFQGSGHGVVCDNKFNNSWNTAYYANCDVWARNTVSGKAVEVTIPRPTACSIAADDITGKMNPITDAGAVTADTLKTLTGMGASAKAYMQVGESGAYACGVPVGRLHIGRNATHYYFGCCFFYNAWIRYTGCLNRSNGGWRHCDAFRLVFADGKSVTVYPSGQGCEASESLGVGPTDYGCLTSGSPYAYSWWIVVRVRKDKLAALSNKKFNAMTWNEDFRELKLLFPAADEDTPVKDLSDN